jgi:hypothetical protein
VARQALACGTERPAMISLAPFQGSYLCREFIDFRKSIDGLSAIVEEKGLDPFGKCLFIFCTGCSTDFLQFPSGKRVRVKALREF